MLLLIYLSSCGSCKLDALLDAGAGDKGTMVDFFFFFLRSAAQTFLP